MLIKNLLCNLKYFSLPIKIRLAWENLCKELGYPKEGQYIKIHTTYGYAKTFEVEKNM